MSNAKNASAAKPQVAGAIYRAPLGTALPTDAISKLGAAFKECGYLSADGLVNANSPTSTQLKAWGGATVATVQTDRPDTFRGTFIEALNPEVLKTVYGDANVTGASPEAGITIKAGPVELEAHSWVFEMILKGGVLKRIVLPSASVSEIGDITYKDDTLIGYATTLSAEPDAAGFSHYEYIKTKGA